MEYYPNDIKAFERVLLKSDEFKFHYKQKLANEYILRDGRKFISDIPIETYEGIIINIESQASPINYDTKTRFNLYQAALHKVHQKQVITVVFSTLYDKHELITHKINQYDGFTMLIISLKALNQKQTLNNTLYKVKNNIGLSDKEKAMFLLSPMMDLDNKIIALSKSIDIVFSMKNIPKDEHDDMKNILFLFLKSWKEEDKEINGGKNMVVLDAETKKFIETHREEGREEGDERRAVSVAYWMLNRNMSMEDIKEATGLSMSKINQLCSSE